MTSERILTLAQQPFIRPGAVDFDNAYAVAIYDAHAHVCLDRMIAADPHKKHVFPYGSNDFALMGYVPAIAEAGANQCTP